MSKRPTKVSFDQGRPSSTATCPGASSSKAGVSSKKKFTLPALSILPKTPPLDPALERLKKKTIRRNAPKGEDVKRIKEIIRGMNKEVVTVQEFVGLVSSYTGDNGNVLRAVMGDDLSSFRRMAKRVYDTMTQDVSDVLANEQIHLTEYYNERYTLFMDKMMRTIDEIYQYVPNFNFESYYTDPDYLTKLFPIETELTTDPEEKEMQRRQEAYHRLQWLRSEGQRLGEENDKLQKRLKVLKTQQREDLLAAQQQEAEAEQRKNELETTQTCLQDQLHELNESVEKTIILTEEEIRLAEDAKLVEKAATSYVARERAKLKQKQQPWNVKMARSMEAKSFKADAENAASNVSVGPALSAQGGAKKKARPKMKRSKPRIPNDEDFHYSPPRAPLASKERELSPFHYSPPKTPPQEPFHCGSPRSTARGGPSPPGPSVRIQSEQEQQAQARQQYTGRRNLAPQDSWSGFG